MKDDKLLEFFEMHKNGKIHIWHPWTAQISNSEITLENLYRMFELVREKRENGVRQD